MAFSLHDFVFDTCKGMVGHEPDYKVKEYVLGWFSKGALTQDDLAEIDLLIEEKNKPVEPLIIDLPLEGDAPVVLPDEPLVDNTVEDGNTNVADPV